MNPREKDLLRVFAASLFVVPQKHCDALGALLAAWVLFTVYFFRLTGNYFPKKFFRAAVLVFVAVMIHFGFWITEHTSYGWSPLWMAGYVLLLDFRDWEAKSLRVTWAPVLWRLLYIEGTALSAAVVFIGRSGLRTAPTWAILAAPVMFFLIVDWAQKLRLSRRKPRKKSAA